MLDAMRLLSPGVKVLILLGALCGYMYIVVVVVFVAPAAAIDVSVVFAVVSFDIDFD